MAAARDTFYIRAHVPKSLWLRVYEAASAQPLKTGASFSMAAVVRQALEEYLTSRGQ